MGKVCGTVRTALGLILLSGCGSTGLVDLGNGPTRLDPLPVKGALGESSVIVGVPVKVERRVTGGYRSIVDLRFEVKLTEPDGVDVPLIPNGAVVGPRVCW